MKKLKAFDSSYFIGKTHFEEDGTQNYSDILNELLVLVTAISFITGNLKDFLMNELIILEHPS